MAEKLFLLKWLKKVPAFVGHIYTMFAVLFGWVLFAFEDFGKGTAFLKTMFGGGSGFISNSTLYQILSYLPLLIVCLVAATPLAKKIYGKLSCKTGEGILLTVDSVRIAGIMFLSIAYLISGSYNPFLYFRF